MCKSKTLGFTGLFSLHTERPSYLDGILKLSKGAKTKVNINNFYFDNMVKVRKKAKISN